MTFAVACVWKVSLVLAVALVADRLLRRVSASVRDLIWTLTFAVLLLLPPVSYWAPQWHGPETAISVVYSATATTVASAGSSINWIAWIWFTGFLVALLRLGIAHARAARLVRRSQPLARGVRQSPPGTMPLTWGLFRPVILIPEDASRWAEEVQQSVLRHESAHVRRLDLPRQFLEQVACALYWFHPLVWYAAVRADDARESACDDAVLSEGSASADYASHLIEVARRVRPLGSVAATTFCNRLEGRIMSVLDTKRSRRAVTRNAVLAGVLASGLLLTAISGMQILAQDEGTDDTTVYEVGDGVTPPKLIKQVEPEYSEEASKARYQGTVVVRVVIGDDGTPRDLRVLRPLGLGLDEKAVEAVQQWRWEPAMKDGEPVQAAAQVEINFRFDPGGQLQGQGDEGVYRIGGDVSAPTVIHKVDTEYSEEARDAGLQGTVVLSVVIDEEGVSRDLKVLKSLGMGLDEKAMEALEQWRWRPAMKDGKPVKVAAQVEINFRRL